MIDFMDSFIIRNIVSAGVGTYNHKHDDITIKAYYQWVPFVLFMQACMFYAPHLLCKSWEGGKVSFNFSLFSVFHVSNYDFYTR